VTLDNGSQVSGGNCSTIKLIATGGCRLVQANADPFDPSLVNLVAKGASAMWGDAFADATSTLNIDLSGASRWTGAAHNVTTAKLDATSLWVMTGNSTVSKTTTNAGRIEYVAPVNDPALLASYKTLTTRDYVGQGGTIVLNTFLGGDGAPSDRLVINGGTATGLTLLSIANTTGPGAQTLGNGILVVQAINGATTQPGAFALANVVAAGAWRYGLFRGSVDTSAPENWYLRNMLRQEVPIDSVVPPLASRLGREMLGTYMHRTGGEFAPAGPAPAEPIWCKDPARNFQCTPTPEQAGVYAGSAAPAEGPRFWGRLLGARGSFGEAGDGTGSLGEGGAAYRFSFAGAQGGVDFHRTEEDIAGLYAGILTLGSVVDAADGSTAGSAGINAYSVGGYWTHRDAAGWYSDLVLQGSFYDVDTHSVADESFSTIGWGVTASAEAGYAFALGDDYSIIPQAQLVWQRTAIDGGADSFGLIDYEATNELYARIGVQLSKQWLMDDGRRMSAYLEANLWHHIGADARTIFSELDGSNPATIEAGLGGTWAQFGAGLTGEIDDDVSVFGQIDYSVGLSQPGSSIGARAGVKVAW
jgi:outer membrane autotransporter protein